MVDAAPDQACVKSVLDGCAAFSVRSSTGVVGCGKPHGVAWSARSVSSITISTFGRQVAVAVAERAGGERTEPAEPASSAGRGTSATTATRMLRRSTLEDVRHDHAVRPSATTPNAPLRAHSGAESRCGTTAAATHAAAPAPSASDPHSGPGTRDIRACQPKGASNASRTTSSARSSVGACSPGSSHATRPDANARPAQTSADGAPACRRSQRASALKTT